MKVSFVTANLNSGGAERVISLLANEFDRHGYLVEIIFLKERVVFYSINPQVKLVVADEECHSKAMWKKMWWLRNYIKQTKPDAVIPFRVSVYTTTLFSLFGLSVPIVASERIDPHISDPLWNMLRMLLLPFSSHLIVQTSYIKSYYPKFIQKKTTIIPNPVRDEVFSLPHPTLIEGCSDKINRIISVARLAPQKNQKMMIKAFAKVADEFPDWQLVIFGEGPLRAELEFLVSSFKLQGRVLLPGRTEHVIEELRKSKIFCLSSDYEGLSNAMIEAICVGLPIISTCVSGTEDVLVNGKNGFIIPINDQDALVHSLRTLLQDEQLRNGMGKNNLRQAKLFNIEGIYSQWEKLINTIVNNED